MLKAPMGGNSIFEQLYFCAFRIAAITLELLKGKSCIKDGKNQ